MMKIPYFFVLGDKEVEDGTVNIRTRKGEVIGTMKLDEAIAMLQEEIDTKAIR